MQKSTFLLQIKHHAPKLISLLCAAFMLIVLPLLFNDAFFDINRVKVNAVYAVVPVLAALMLAALLLCAKGGKKRLPGRGVGAACCALLFFVLACAASCAMAGFTPAVLLGNEGRYCGLYFVLCCAMAFFMIAGGNLRGRGLSFAVMAAASAVAALGFLNALGVDPLGFYERIKAGQETLFLSTIGHFDFFGTYLVMILPIAAGAFVFAKSGVSRAVGGVCAALIALGAYASRTDSSFIGLHLAMAALLAVSGDSFRQIARACFAWSGAMLALPATQNALSYSAFSLSFSAPLELMSEFHIALALAALLALAGILCIRLEKAGRRAPGKRRTMLAVFSLLALAAVLLISVIVYFTVFDTQANLGSAETFLRFSDRWGSYRGFVYQRALLAFEDFTPTEKLFGKGMDTALSILQPYFDDPAMLVTGVFNDTHNQILQMLITCGLFGAVSFAGFYLAMLFVLLRRCGNDPLLCGAFASVFAYSVVILLNVTQPILIATYFSLCALAISRIGYLYERK